MLVSFVGAPGSGKTTTAAMVFADLKEEGMVCEFITEQARAYIAECRYRYQIDSSQPVSLSDEDQVEIMERQQKIDMVFSYSAGSELVIADSSPLNALLYMTESMRMSPYVKNVTREAAEAVDLVCFAPTIHPGTHFDPNRVHNYEQSIEIEKSLNTVFNTYCPEILPKVLRLSGSPQTRKSQVIRAIMELRTQCL